MWKLTILVNHRVSSARNHMEQPQPFVLDPKLCTEILCRGYADIPVSFCFFTPSKVAAATVSGCEMPSAKQ